MASMSLLKLGPKRSNSARFASVPCVTSWSRYVSGLNTSPNSSCADGFALPSLRGVVWPKSRLRLPVKLCITLRSVVPPLAAVVEHRLVDSFRPARTIDNTLNVVHPLHPCAVVVVRPAGRLNHALVARGDRGGSGQSDMAPYRRRNWRVAHLALTRCRRSVRRYGCEAASLPQTAAFRPALPLPRGAAQADCL